MNSRMQIRRVKADATIELSRLATGLDDAWATQEAWVASLDPIVGDTSDSLPGPVAAVLDAEETMRDALRSSGRLATIQGGRLYLDIEAVKKLGQREYVVALAMSDIVR